MDCASEKKRLLDQDIPKCLMSWILNYLTNRTQYVRPGAYLEGALGACASRGDQGAPKKGEKKEKGKEKRKKEKKEKKEKGKKRGKKRKKKGEKKGKKKKKG